MHQQLNKAYSSQWALRKRYQSPCCVTLRKFKFRMLKLMHQKRRSGSLSYGFGLFSANLWMLSSQAILWWRNKQKYGSSGPFHWQGSYIKTLKLIQESLSTCFKYDRQQMIIMMQKARPMTSIAMIASIYSANKNLSRSQTSILISISYLNQWNLSPGPWLIHISASFCSKSHLYSLTTTQRTLKGLLKFKLESISAFKNSIGKVTRSSCWPSDWS